MTADTHVDMLWVITEPTRRVLLDALLQHGAATATTLAEEVPVSRQAVVKHLMVLDRAGVVEATRAGREVRYSVRAKALNDAAREMARVASRWDQRLLRIKQIAEATHRTQGGRRS